MASISKLSIRGIRSFSPDDDEQVIGFCFPLTIIVGANGCGKTTIIESLKYAVTGSLPPGVKAGQSFIHDPKSLGTTSVKGSIKLRFNNTEGSSMVVARSMEVTQKKTTASFKALDGTLRTVNRDTGERVTMSHKCTELDKNIPFFLGVSKPILEHVVFCHQEDSSWPLQEGAVLKKRFDDIFDSTRYAKALEAIKAERKTYASMVKELKAELEGLNSHKHAATGFRQDLEECRDKISGVEDKIQVLNDEIDREQAVGREAQDAITRIDDFQLQLEQKRSHMVTQEAVFNKQKDLLGKDDLTQTHTYSQLKERLGDLEDQRHGNEATRNLEAKEDECRHMERDLEELRRKSNRYNSRKGMLDAEREAHSRVVRQRFAIMEGIHKEFKIDLESFSQEEDDGTLTQGTTNSRITLGTMLTTATSSTNDITPEDMAAFQQAVEKKKAELEGALASAKHQHRADEDANQKEILALEAKKATQLNDRSRNESAKRQAVQELNEIASQMSSSFSRVRKEQVEEAKEAANCLAEQRDKCNRDHRRGDIINEIRVQEELLKTISGTIEQDNKIRDQLRQKADEQNEIDMLDKQAASEFHDLLDLVKENSFSLSSQGEDVRITKENPVEPVEALHNSVRTKLLGAQDDVDRFTADVGNAQRKVSEKQALLDNHRNRLQQLQNKKNSLLQADSGATKIKSVIKALIRMDKDTIDHNRINDDCPPSELLKYLGEQVNGCRNYEEKPESISRLIKRLKKLAKTSMACPCCDRGFDNESEITAFQSKMAELADPAVSELHQMASKKAQELSIALEKYEKFRNIISENMADFIELSRVNAELKEVEVLVADEEGGGYGSLKELESELKTEKENLEEKKCLVKELECLMSSVNTIQDTAKRVWEKMRIVQDKKDHLSHHFFGNDIGDARDLKTVEKDLAKSSEKKERAYSTINKLNNEQKKINEDISRITNQAAAAERNARDKEETFKRDQETTKRKDQLNEELKRLTQDMKKLESEMAPVRTQLMQKQSDRDRLRDNNAREDGTLSSKVQDFKRGIDKLREVNDKVDEYVRSDKESQIREVERKLDENKQNIRAGEADLDKMKPQLETLKKQVEDGERQKKIIIDNLELFKLQKKLTQLKEEIESAQNEVNGMGGDGAREKYDTSLSNIRHNQTKIERYNGRVQGLTEQKRHLRRKLNEPEYKGVDERQRKKMIEHETTGIVVADLDKYYDALDKALLRYHGIKINDINKIIRELWTLTYKGEDITNIEIQSGQESSARANRSYNYRIVMSKGNTQMDMRGRCSAGQRVLASIVIRLALAETFCLNCGVMALDEPTTNLDYENKRGLAIALSQIIASRAAQSNFQLVVITHDEDFVSVMKQELSSQTGFGMPERYYQVSREQSHDGRFYSKICAVDWDDL